MVGFFINNLFTNEDSIYKVSPKQIDQQYNREGCHELIASL